MNDDLQKALAEFIKQTLAGFQVGKDFVLAQAPEIIQQLIRWNFWESTCLAIGCAVVTLTLWVIAYRVRGLPHNEDKGLPTGLLGFIGFCFSIGAVVNADTALYIYLAPKVWLIEWAMKQAKS